MIASFPKCPTSRLLVAGSEMSNKPAAIGIYISTRLIFVPKGHWKLAGGEAQRNHRNRIGMALKP
jgi:hypothetical protein